MSKSPTYTEISRVYVAKHKDDMIFTRSQWHQYKIGTWNPVHDLKVDREIWDLLERYESSRDVRPSDAYHRNVLKYTKSSIFVEDNRMDNHTRLVNLENGVFNLDDGQLYPHDKNLYFTTQLPFAYDPDATAPMWEHYIGTTFVLPRSYQFDPELAAFIQEAMGYSLTTDISYHVMFWLLGEGSNGKGVLFHMLENLAGNASTALNLDLLRREHYQLANLAGKRIALCPESRSTDNLVDDAMIKALVSGDTIKVRQIRREPFDLHTTVKLWWAMNKIPAIADTSHGFWRRVRIIPFNRTFIDSAKIPDLKEQLLLELPGIFNWAVEGLNRLNKNGKFTTVKQVEDLTAKYQLESNPVAMFVEEKYEPDPLMKVQSSMIYTDYKGWCFDNNYKPHSSKNFKREMENLGYFSIRHSNAVYFTGLKIKI